MRAVIEAKGKAKRAAKGLKVSGTVGKTKVVANGNDAVAPKYQHPKTGATWSGRGRAPSWIAEAKDRSKFLIADGSQAAVAASEGVVSKTKVAGKKTASKSVGATAGHGQPKGPQPAKYADPKSGATWSGRGPAPAWLAGAKDRSKFLIAGGAAVGASEADLVNKASKPNAAAKKVTAGASPTAKKAVSVKKVTAKKVTSKKAASVKTAAAKVVAPAAPQVSTDVGA